MKSSDFVLRFLPPTANSVIVKVSYTLVATRAFCVDQTRQAQNEGFRLARIASSYLSNQTHDSNRARYVSTTGTKVCSNLRNQDGFIFGDPLPMGASTLYLLHTDAQPRNTPTMQIVFSKPSFGEITPQGFVTASSDPNDDNVDLWANFDTAKEHYTRGERIGRLVYTLKATRPQNFSCDVLQGF